MAVNKQRREVRSITTFLWLWHEATRGIAFCFSPSPSLSREFHRISWQFAGVKIILLGWERKCESELWRPWTQGIHSRRRFEPRPLDPASNAPCISWLHLLSHSSFDTYKWRSIAEYGSNRQYRIQTPENCTEQHQLANPIKQNVKKLRIDKRLLLILKMQNKRLGGINSPNINRQSC